MNLMKHQNALFAQITEILYELNEFQPLSEWQAFKMMGRL